MSEQPHRALWAIVPEWVLWHPELSDGAVRLYATIHRYVGLNEGAWPRNSVLAERLGRTQRSVRNWLAELEAVGAVEREARFAKGGQQLSNMLRLRSEPVENLGGEEPPFRGGRNGGAGGGGTYVPPVEGEPGEPEPSISPPTPPDGPTPPAATGASAPRRRGKVHGVEEVFDAWRASTGKARSVLDAGRRRLIERAIGTHGLEVVMQAVQGWGCSPYHAGVNRDGKVWNDLELILRNAQKIEGFSGAWVARAGRPLSEAEVMVARRSLMSGGEGGPVRSRSQQALDALLAMEGSVVEVDGADFVAPHVIDVEEVG